MQIKDILEILERAEKRRTPSDVLEILDIERYSHSKNEYIKIGEMELTHFIRVFNQTYESINEPRQKLANELEMEMYKKWKLMKNN